MKLVKLLLATMSYLLVFIVVFTVLTQVIDNFITDDAIRNFASFFGIHDAEGILDLYQNTAMVVSALLALGVTLLCRLHIRRKLRTIEQGAE